MNVFHRPDYDEERQKAFLMTAMVFWIVIFLFLIFRDPVWRIFNEADVFGKQTESQWVQVNPKMIKSFLSIKNDPVKGLTSMEDAILEVINRHREDLGANQGRILKDIVLNQKLTDIARARATRRLACSPADVLQIPEFKHPKLYFSTIQTDRIAKIEEIFQRLKTDKPDTSQGFVNELTGGWLNHTQFRSLLASDGQLDVGVGAVVSDSGETGIEVILRDTFVQFDYELPVIEKKVNSRLISGACQDSSVELLIKGPTDALFKSINIQWKAPGSRFEEQISFDQGPGVYHLKAKMADRVSDIKRIVKY